MEKPILIYQPQLGIPYLYILKMLATLSFLVKNILSIHSILCNGYLCHIRGPAKMICTFFFSLTTLTQAGKLWIIVNIYTNSYSLQCVHVMLQRYWLKTVSVVYEEDNCQIMAPLPLPRIADMKWSSSASHWTCHQNEESASWTDQHSDGQNWVTELQM